MGHPGRPERASSGTRAVDSQLIETYLIETREFGKYNGNVSKDVLINNSIYTRRQKRP